MQVVVRRGLLFMVVAVGVVLVGAVTAYTYLALTDRPGDRSAWIPAPGTYDVEILRDTWGVPHIFGKTDADAAYGLAFAHCEDDWENMEDAALLVNASMAAKHGVEAAKFDFLVQLFRVQEFVADQYERALSPELRAICEAYADGMNHYAALFPERMPHLRRPVTGQDIVAGATFKSPFFYEFHKDLEMLMAGEGGTGISRKGVGPGSASVEPDDLFAQARHFGSNAWAVAPARSADGATRLAINSHQPWTGPVAWYEAHVSSEEGWNMVGGTFPGGPLIFKGHDEFKGWCHTINRPDLVDIYGMTVNPDNPRQYRFDGEWRDFKVREAQMTVRLWGPVRWTVTRPLLYSEHGPCFEAPSGTYAIKFAGYGEVRQLEQWYRMNKARTFEEFRSALRMMGLISLNTLYADRDGNLLYLYNGHFPQRPEGFDWGGFLPGDTSEALWSTIRPYTALPRIVQPESGFVQTCNNSPYFSTDGADNPRPEDFPEDMGVETYMTNRGLRALETYGADPEITRDEFFDYKYDKFYSDNGAMAGFQADVVAMDPGDDPLLSEARAVIAGWNRTTTAENEEAALAIMASEPYIEAVRFGDGEVDPATYVREAAETMMRHHGRLRIPWSEMMRLRRGDLDLPLDGGPDCLRAIDPLLDEDGRFRAVNGDCYYLMVEWMPDGTLVSQSIHQFGAATVDRGSPHYADQAPLFARYELKPVWLSEEEVRANLKLAYRPGDIGPNWYEHAAQSE